MSDLLKLELAHTLMSEDDARRFLGGHRISLGERTMDTRAILQGLAAILEVAESLRERLD